MTMKRGRSQSSEDEVPPTKRGNSETSSDNGDQELNSIEDASALATAVPSASIVTENNEAIADSAEVAVGDHEQDVEAMESEVPTILDNTQQTQNVSAVVPAVGLMVVAPEFTVVHDSWEHFEETLRAYATATYQLYVIRSTTSVKRRNLKIAESAAKGDASGLVKKGLVGVEHSSNAVEEAPERTLIPEQFQWYSKSLKCTHGWKDRHRGTGKRGSGVVRSTSCPAKMCVTLQHRGTGSGDWKVVVTKHVRTHNHQLSKELYLYYTENRRIYDPELLAVVGEEVTVATENGTSSNNLANAHLASLIDQANQRGGAFRVMTSGEDGAAQIQQPASSMTFIVPELSTVLNSTPNGRAGNQLVPFSESSSGNFVIRPRLTAGAMSVASPPVGTLILTPGTIPSKAMVGGGFCVPRVSVKLHSSWDAFHDYIAQYSFDTAQVFRTRSTVSVSARNAKILTSMAAKAGVDNHSIASYASYSAASPTSRLIPEEYKWFSKLLICTYGWKRRARIKGPRINNDHDGGGPCPAMLLARIERNVDGEWNVVINRQVQEHNHKLNGHAEEMDDNNHEEIAPAEDVSGEFVTAPTGALIPAHMSHSVDTAAHLESEVIATEASIGDLAAQPTEHREIVVRVPKLQSVFKSWDDFHASLKHYSDATYQLYRTRTTSSAEGRNKKIAQMKRGADDGNDGISGNISDPDLNVARKIPDSWRWYSKTLTCTHGWKERNRGTGKRNAHGVRSTACPVKICATVQYVAPTSRLASDVASVEKDEVSENCWRVVVTKHVVDHNHNLSRALYQHYCENRRIYDRELLAIDASSEGAVVKRKVYQSPDHVTTSNEHSSAQSSDGQMVFQHPLLSAQFEAMPAEDGVHAQVFGNMVGIGGNGTTDMQQPASAISTSAVGMTQSMVPSVVLLPYSASSLYGQNLRSPAQHQRQQQHDDTVQNQNTFAGNRAAAQTRENEGTEGAATLAAIAATQASIPLRNNTGISSSSASSHSMSAGLCRVHGTIAGHSVPTNSTENAPAQCTCLRNAGGGNYIAIVPASEPLASTETSFDADDDTMLYAEDMDGVWQPASNVEIEKVTNENGEMIWRVPRLVRRYPTWDAFHKCLDAYSAATFQLYRVRTTYSVKSRNTRLRQLAASRGLTVREGDVGDAGTREDTEQDGAHGLSRAHLVPEQYEWYSKTFLCTHGWKRRSRGSGQRVSHNVRATECPAKVCATLQRTDGATNWSIVVTKHLTEHNHEISEAIYQQYSEVRRVKDPEVLIQAEQLWRGGATRRRVFEFLKDRSPNQVILMKDVHNLVQRWQSQERRPRQDHQQDEDEDVQEEQEQSSQVATVVSSTGSHDDSSWL